jgi:hypothetical protein
MTVKINKFNVFLFIGIILLMSSCAASYNSINPSKVKYSSVQAYDTAVVLQYKYNVLEASGNKKYFKKEAKFKTNLVAIKITNNTDSVINTNQLMFSSGDRYIVPLTPGFTRKMLRQKGEFHLFYLLLSPLQFYSGTTSTPVGLVLGPGLAILNISIAAAANEKFEGNLKDFSIQNKEIKPKESIYGLVGFVNSKGEPIYVRYKNKNTN